jgi:hypothetical protein
MSSVASILSGTPAAAAPVVAVSQGTATILNGQSTIAVANTSIAATSIVVAMSSGAGALAAVSVRLTPGVGFSIDSSAAAGVGGIPCSWAILKL